MECITKYIERDLKLIVNQEKIEIGSPTRLKFLSCLMFQVYGTYRFIPTKQAKQKFKNSLKKLTKRNRAGTIKGIIRQINWVTRG